MNIHKDMQKVRHFNLREWHSQFILSGQNNILPSKVQKRESKVEVVSKEVSIMAQKDTYVPVNKHF